MADYLAAALEFCVCALAEGSPLAVRDMSMDLRSSGGLLASPLLLLWAARSKESPQDQATSLLSACTVELSARVTYIGGTATAGSNSRRRRSRQGGPPPMFLFLLSLAFEWTETAASLYY